MYVYVRKHIRFDLSANTRARPAMSSVPFYAIDTSCRSAECYHSPAFQAARRQEAAAALAAGKQQEPVTSAATAPKHNFISSVLQNCKYLNIRLPN